MRRTKMVGASLVAISMLATACGAQQEGTVIEDSQNAAAGGESQPEKVTITFWDENSGPARTPYYEELIATFEAENPDIDVEYVGIPSASAKEKYDVAIAADGLPDVGGLHIMWVADFVARQKLLALDTMYDQWEEKSVMNAASVDEVRSYVQDGKLYFIPNTLSADMIWYRADWFQEAGLKAPETWDDFFTAVEKLTNQDERRYGFSIRGGAGGAHQLKKMMYSYSGISQFFDENGKSTLNDPLHVEFLERYLGLYKKYTPESDITNGYKEMVAAFDTGIAAMIQHNIGSFGEHDKTLEPNQFAGVSLPPSPINGKRIIEGGNSTGYGVFSTTKHPEEAWRFMSYLISADVQSFWNQNIGQLPTNEKALANDWVQNTQHIKVSADALSDPATQFINPPLHLPGYSTILDQIGNGGLQAVLAGTETVESYLNRWAAAMEEEQKKYDEVFKK